MESNVSHWRQAEAYWPLWVATAGFAFLAVAIAQGQAYLVLPQGTFAALSCAAAFLLAGLGLQIHLGRAAGHLARLAWMAMALYGLWLTVDLYPFFAEAAEYALASQGEPKAPQLGALPRLWLAYYALCGLVWALALGMIVQAMRFAFEEARQGPASHFAFEQPTDPLLRFWISLWGEPPPHGEMAYAPPPGGGAGGGHRGEPPLSTRDTEALRPQLTFASLSGNQEVKEKLLKAAREWDNGGRKDGKNGILFFGEPGTGKTAFAEALAGELKLPIIKANVGSIASRWINQTTEQLHDLLESALRQAPCVLFLDEIDSVFPDRTQMSTTNAEEGKVIGTFLSAVEKLRRGRVLLIAATNYKDRVDPAAIRTGRFDFHIEMPLPDHEARKGLIRAALAKSGAQLDEGLLERVSRRWAGFNVPRIQEAARRAAELAQGQKLRMRDFLRALRDVQGNRAGPPESAPGFESLYFDEAVKERLKEIAATFAHVEEIEAKGGSVPKGIVFYGPPGTGKTSMAQALAKAAGWTFIATSGKEIAAQTDKLAQIRRQASDLRPAIVFIDEADDILGDRSRSGLKLHTNDLLRIIDGAGEPLPDVCWILATNRVDELDAAVFRRFPVKIELGLPSRETLRRFIYDWAKSHAGKIAGTPEAWADEVAAELDGLAPSVVKNILETALNAEAARAVLWDAPMSITLEEVRKARAEMAL